MHDWITGLPGAVDRGIMNSADYNPDYDYGSILPFRINKKTKTRELALPGLLKDVARAISAPKRAYDGLLDVNSPEATQEAMNLVGLLQLGGAGISAAKNPKGIIQPGTLGATVYHGSPYKFDKFDMSKIGTGEGAQAYGHGLYLAEKPQVAMEYQRVLASRNQGAVIRAKGGIKRANEYAAKWQLMLDDKSIQRPMRAKDEPVNDDWLRAQITDEIGEAKRLAEWADKRDLFGSLYKADLPDEQIAKMLDWDKPLSEQSQHVQDAIIKAAKGHPLEKTLLDPRNTGGAILRAFEASSAEGQIHNASNLLKKHGIPGIRYLDANSRGTGGTSNYVVFDDKLLTILERNGQPIKGLLNK